MTDRLSKARNRSGALQNQLDAFELLNGCNINQMTAAVAAQHSAILRQKIEADEEWRAAEHEFNREVHIPGTADINKP